MKKFLLYLSVFCLWTCSDGGDKATGPEEPPIVVNLTSLTGQAQKGPFNNGTSINVAELSNTLSPTGRNFSSAITDNTGRFAVANVQLESPYVELRANGFYFNEVSNEISDAQLTLFAISNLTGKTSLNVNILTHLEKNRMITLMSGDNPKTFAQAKLQAQEEVFAIFDYSRANVPESELLDISQGGAANGKLLAMSAIIQGDLTVGQMSQLLANMSTDIAADGTLDDTNLRNTLIDNSKNLNMAEVRSNLVAHYTSLGISATIPDFESEINQFLKPPVAQDMSVSTAEDTPINITLAASDPEGESLTYTILEVNNATVTLNGNVATYTPDAHFNGTDTFTYYANDGTSDSNIATVTMTVSGEDDDPNTQNAAATTDEDVAVVLQLSAEEYDGDSYSFGIISNPSNGSVSLDGANATYTPNQDWNGTDTFTFEATDDTGRIMNVATATITVNPVNDAPTANDVTTSTDENLFNRNNTNIDITYDADNDILFNNNIKGTSSFGNSNSVDITLDGTDIDGDNLTYSVVATNNGSVTINGAIATYEPTQDWNGEDSFTYVANDGTVDSNTATVTITVNSVNDAPVIIPAANNGTTTMNEDDSMYEQFTATDVDGDDVTFSIVTNPEHATITNFTNDDPDCPGNCASFTFVPNENWNGTDTFTYKANDGSLDSAIETHTFIVNPVNDAPVANDITNQVTDENRMMQLDITLDATDVEGDALTYNITSTNNGSVTINDNIATYVPNQNWNGEDTFNYVASDGIDSSNTATVTITVNSVNDPPQALDITVDSINEDTAHNFLFEEGMIGENTGGFAGIDVDNNPYSGQTLDFILVSQPSNGSLSIDGSTISIGDLLNDKSSSSGLNILYTPNNNFNGTDSFTYKANDGELDSNNVGTATITFVPVNDAPVTTDISATTNEDTSLLIHFEDGVNIIDIDNEIAQGGVTGSIVSLPANGNLYKWNGDDNTPDTTMLTVGDQLENSAGLIKAWYVPNSNFNGTDTFTYKANDGSLDSNTATVTITVNPVYDSDETDLTSSQLEFGMIFEDINSDNMLNVDYNNNKITLFDKNLNILSSYQFSSDVTPWWAISKADGSWVIITDNDEDSVNGTSMWSVSWYGFDSSLSLSSQSEEFMVPSYSTISYDAYFLPNGNLLINGLKRCTDDSNSCSWEPVIIESDSQGKLVQYITEFDNESMTTKLFMKDSYYFLLAGNKIFEMDFDGNVTNSFNTPSTIPSFNYYGFLETIDGGYAILSNQRNINEDRFFNINKNPKQSIFNRFSSMKYDITLTKFDGDFNQEWSTVLDINSNGSSYDQATRVIQDQADGSYYALGRTIYNFVDYSDYQFDIFTAKFDVNGSNIFSSIFGNDSFHDIPKLISFNEYNQLSIFALKYTDPKESWIFKIDKDGIRTDKTF